MEIQNILTGNEKIVVTGDCSFNIATQLLVPFLYHHNGKKQVKYIEVDDINDLTGFFKESKIITSEKVKVDNDVDLSMIMSNVGNAVINLGNTSRDSLNVIKAIGDNRDFEEVYWFIPLRTGKDDAQKALSTYFKIQDIYADYKEKPRIIFVLCGNRKADEKYIESIFHYFFDSSSVKLDFVLKNEILKEDFKYIFYYENSFCINHSMMHKEICLKLRKKSIPDMKSYVKFIKSRFSKIEEFIKK